MAKRSLVNIAPTQTNYEDVEEAEPPLKKKCGAGLNCDNIESADQLEDVEEKKFLTIIGMDSKPRVTADLSMISTTNDVPTDVYKYMVENASSLQQSKLMEAGKIFYPKEFVNIDNAVIDQDGIECYKKENGSDKNVVAKLSQRLWIAEDLYFDESTDDVISSLPKSAVCNLQKLYIDHQVMSYENFKYLTSSGDVEIVHMYDTHVLYNDIKNEVPLEKIFELLPNCSRLIFKGNAPSIVSLEAANIHRPSNLCNIKMCQLDEKFDFKAFSNFMISNQNIEYYLTFKFGISNSIVSFVRELDSIIFKIKKTWNDQTALPYIRIY